jgi:hypothetical protein
MASSPTRPLTPVPAAAAAAAPGLTDKQRQTIGVAALLLCLLLGGGVIWWFFYGSAPTRTQVTVDPKEQSPGQVETRGIRMMREPRRITRPDPSTYLVRGNVGQFRAVQKGQAWELSDFVFVGGSRLSNEQLTMLTSRWRILHDPAMAKAWGVTPEQRDQLEKIAGGSGGFEPTPDQRQALLAAMANYHNAGDGPTRSDAQAKVLDLIDADARGSFDAARKAAADRADRVRHVFTKEQLKKILGK